MSNCILDTLLFSFVFIRHDCGIQIANKKWCIRFRLSRPVELRRTLRRSRRVRGADSPSISKSIIISSSSPILTSQLYTLYRLATNIIFTALSLILNQLVLSLQQLAIGVFLQGVLSLISPITLISLFSLVILYSATSSLLRLRIASLAPQY